jgi:hypothetical protein
LGRTARHRRADPAPDARAGRKGAADGRRRHHRRRVRLDRRPRRRRHADDLRARPAQAAGSQGRGGEIRAKNFEPQAYTLYSYAAVQIIKQAAEAAKSLDPKKVAEQIKSGMKFKTVIGDLSYDKKGDVTRLDYVIYVWKKDPSGKITYAEIE